MRSEIQTIDSKARLVLPKSFANATVTIEQLSETEIRIRRADVVDDKFPFAEELASPLSDRDREHFLKLLADPPAPVPALKNAAARHKASRR